MNIIEKYFPSLTKEQKEQIAELKPIYADWNSKINVISRKDIDALYERHILHSLAIAQYIQFTDNTKVLDVGTGGGFPGIPLAIMFPNVSFHLVDSIGKKIKVVNSVAETLNLKNVRAEQVRAESINKSYDFVVSRAVTNLSTFVGWIKNKVSKKQKNNLKNGILYLKGGDLKQELAPFGKKVIIKNLSDYFDEEFFETKKIIYLPF